MATFAVGDVQGCYTALQCALKKAGFNQRKDCLWFVGDLVNRGPDSLGVLRFARDLGERGKVVLGNHDLHLLAVAEGLRKAKRKDTIDDVLGAPDGPELLHWLRQQPLLYSDERLGYAMVHAGIPPIWSLKRAADLAREVEECLRSDHYRDFLEAMYGNEPLRWNKQLSGLERLRVITNYLTRMRFCTANGTLDLEDSESAESTRPGYRPWFAYNLNLGRQQLLFGHWAAIQGVTRKKRIHALDTGCIWGGAITLMRLDDQVRIRCSCPPVLRTRKRR